MPVSFLFPDCVFKRLNMCLPRILVAVVFFRMAVASGSLPVLGGLSKADTNSKEVVQAALFATNTFNLHYSKEAAAFKAMRVVSASKQVVAGMNYFLQMYLGLTQCRKNAPYWAFQSCPLQAPYKPLLCEFVVYEVSWENRMDLTKVSCRRLSKT